MLCALSASVGILFAQKAATNLFSVFLRMPRGSITWGAETNTLRGGLSVLQSRTQTDVEVCVKKSTNSVGPAATLTNTAPRNWRQEVGAVSAGQNYWETMEFVSATNSFCGPVELLDEAGSRVVPADQGLMSLTAYPSSFQYSDVARNEFKKPTISHIMPARRIDLKADVPTSLVTFNITEMFHIKKSGRYRLTVYPIIYKRSGKNTDVYERVDLPPITTSVELKSEGDTPTDTGSKGGSPQH
jgi:hypothetical protein